MEYVKKPKTDCSFFSQLLPLKEIKESNMRRPQFHIGYRWILVTPGSVVVGCNCIPINRHQPCYSLVYLSIRFFFCIYWVIPPIEAEKNLTLNKKWFLIISYQYLAINWMDCCYRVFQGL